MNKPAKSYDFLWLIIKSSSIFLLLAVYNSLTIGAYAYSGTQAEMHIEVPGNSAATQQKSKLPEQSLMSGEKLLSEQM